MSHYSNAKCPYCGQAVEQTAHSFGSYCPQHARMWAEDIRSGFKQNRLKALMEDPDSYYNQQKKGDDRID